MWNRTSETVISDTETGRTYTANNPEAAEWLFNTIQDATSTVVRLYCKNEMCQDKGGYIDRASETARQVVHGCDTCHVPMVR